MKTQRKNRGITFAYSLVQGFFWMSFAAVMGFSSVYLLDCGLTSSQIGLVLAASGIMAFIIQPVVADYADQPSAFSLKWIVMIICALAFLASVLLFVAYRKSVILTGVFYGCCAVSLQLLMPFINSLGTEMLSQGARLNWGLARGIGSVAYAMLSYVMGILTARAGIIAVPVGIMAGYGFLITGVLIYPFDRKREGAGRVKERMPEAEKRKQGKMAAFLRKYPRFAAVLGGTVLLYISHVLLNNFLYQIIQAKGGGSLEVGFVMSLCAWVELPPMFLFSYMLKKAGSDVWYRLCGVFMAVKAVASLLAPSLPVYYLVQVLQLAGWGLIAIAPVYYVNRVIGKEDAIKGQAYLGMSYTVATVLASLAGGWLIDLAGVQVMLMVASLAGVAGAAVVIGFTERVKP
ncbi:MAG: MFS transporter [Lachnospiraceae bacterium]|nr:MFS transporter [Lachnospiraceae bacterium]